MVSGGAIGIDSIATLVANELNIRMIEHLPKNNRWKPDGFEDRNIKIAEDCSFLLCIRSSQSTTYGSGWTADRAEEMGKPVWRVTI
jgi:predicted Rossmann fold nucleotide-binding protein DprA/Smf involved in DNA uptake